MPARRHDPAVRRLAGCMVVSTAGCPPRAPVTCTSTTATSPPIATASRFGRITEVYGQEDRHLRDHDGLPMTNCSAKPTPDGSLTSAPSVICLMSDTAPQSQCPPSRIQSRPRSRPRAYHPGLTPLPSTRDHRAIDRSPPYLPREGCAATPIPPPKHNPNQRGGGAPPTGPPRKENAVGTSAMEVRAGPRRFSPTTARIRSRRYSFFPRASSPRSTSTFPLFKSELQYWSPIGFDRADLSPAFRRDWRVLPDLPIAIP